GLSPDRPHTRRQTSVKTNTAATAGSLAQGAGGKWSDCEIFGVELVGKISMMNPKLSAPPRGSLERPAHRVPSLLEAEKPSPRPGLLFLPTHSEARERFLESAERMGCHTESWSIPQRGPAGEDLAIDLA